MEGCPISWIQLARLSWCALDENESGSLWYGSSVIVALIAEGTPRVVVPSSSHSRSCYSPLASACCHACFTHWCLAPWSLVRLLAHSHHFSTTSLPDLRASCLALPLPLALSQTSHRVGLFRDICLRYELLLADGSIVTCSRDERPDLFEAVPFSYGCLCFLVSVDIAIIPAHRYVHLKVNAVSVVAPHLLLIPVIFAFVYVARFYACVRVAPALAALRLHLPLSLSTLYPVFYPSAYWHRASPSILTAILLLLATTPPHLCSTRR